MEQTAAFLTFIVITALTPGPNNIMALSTSQRYGFGGSLRFILGVAAGFFLVTTVCATFNLTLDRLLPKAETAMALLGAAYLLYLAAKLFLGRKGVQETKSFASFRTGFLLQFVNAKIYFYALTAFSSFVVPRFGAGRILFLFALLLTFVGVFGTVVWALFGSLFRRLLMRYGEPLNIVMSLLLVYCAFSIVSPIFT